MKTKKSSRISFQLKTLFRIFKVNHKHRLLKIRLFLNKNIINQLIRNNKRMLVTHPMKIFIQVVENNWWTKTRDPRSILKKLKSEGNLLKMIKRKTRELMIQWHHREQSTSVDQSCQRSHLNIIQRKKNLKDALKKITNRRFICSKSSNKIQPGVTLSVNESLRKLVWA